MTPPYAFIYFIRKHKVETSHYPMMKSPDVGARITFEDIHLKLYQPPFLHLHLAIVLTADGFLDYLQAPD